MLKKLILKNNVIIFISAEAHVKNKLIINKKRLAITQKRYNKTYYYPISKSPFLNILYKEKLLEIIQSGELELSDKTIKLIYVGGNEITVFFDRKTLDLKGWQIIDQYNNLLAQKPAEG